MIVDLVVIVDLVMIVDLVVIVDGDGDGDVAVIERRNTFQSSGGCQPLSVESVSAA